MDIAVKKLELLDWIMHLENVSVLEKLLLMKEETEIVGYTVSGEPLNRKQYIEKADKGLRDIEEGRYMTQEELLKDMENW